METDIDQNENAGSLHDRLMVLGSEAVTKTLEIIKAGEVTTQTQIENANLKTAHKLTKENCKIDFQNTGEEIYNFIRGLSPYPAAWCEFHDNGQVYNVRLYEAKFNKQHHDLEKGKITAGKKELAVALTDGLLEIISLQFPGKKIMTASELLNGMRFSANASAT